MAYKSTVLQNSLQLLSEIRNSLANTKSDKFEMHNKQSTQQHSKKQSFTMYEDQDEPRTKIPECSTMIETSQKNSSQLTEDIIELLNNNQKQFDKQCSDIQRQIKELLENIEENEDDSNSIESNIKYIKKGNTISQNQLKGVHDLFIYIMFLNHLNNNVHNHQCVCEYMHFCSDNFCQHNDMYELNPYNSIAFTIIILILGLSSVGGIGGGIEKLPIFMIMLNYPQRQATLFVYATTFGVNVCNFVLLLFQRHPLIDKQIIDYDICLVLLPAVIFGGMIGLMLNRVLPDLASVGILVVFMVVLIPKLYGKLQSDKKTDLESNSDEIQFARQLQQNQDEILEYVIEEKQIIPYKKLIRLILIFALIELLFFLRGGKELKSILGIRFCSPTYWLSTLLIIAILLGCSYLIKAYLTREEEIKIKLNYFHSMIDFSFNWNNFITIWSSGFLGGTMAGLTGVGGGAIMVSFMILKGINSRVASATAGFQKLFIATVTTVLAYQQGQLSIKDILILSGSGILGGIVIAAPLYYYISKSQNQQIIIQIVIFLLILNVFSAVGYLVKEAFVFQRFTNMIENREYC